MIGSGGAYSLGSVIVNPLTFDQGLLSSIREFLTSDTPPITVNIVNTFSTGWKNIPQELVDEILAYLEDDYTSLASCSLSCKALFCSTRPLIHRTFCLSTGCSIDRHRSSPLNRTQFDNLQLAGQAQVLRYATRLIIRLGDDFVPENLRPYLRYFRDMRGVTSLEIYLLDAAAFLPAFEECFGHITPTLRSLALSGARNPIREVFHFISRFPLLQDLDLVQFSLARHKPAQPHTTQQIKIPPPLNGALRFRGTYPSLEFIQSLINIPGGIHFRSVEMGDARTVPLQTVIDACSNDIESITFWTGYRECLRFHIASHTVFTLHIVSGGRAEPQTVYCPQKAQDRTSGRYRHIPQPPSLPLQGPFEYCIAILLYLRRQARRIKHTRCPLAPAHRNHAR